MDVELKRYGTQLVKISFFNSKYNGQNLFTGIFSFTILRKNWCTASVIADTFIHNLELWNQFKSIKNTETKTLKLFQPLYLKFANSAQKKLERHLWYVFERHIGFSLFGEKLSVMEKTEMWKKL